MFRGLSLLVCLAACASSEKPTVACEPDVSCGSCGRVRCTDDGPRCSSDRLCAYFQSVAVWPRNEPSDSPWGSGIALGDIDGNDTVDVIVGAAERVFVYRRGADGTFTRTEGFIDAPPRGTAGLTLVDYDGDGDLDLFLTAQSPNPGIELWENRDGRFRDASHRLPEIDRNDDLQLGGPSWGDFDLDGDLDVFVPAYTDQRSYLLRNDGSDFVDVAADFGVDAPAAASLQGLFVDYDVDGDVDLIVANDKGRTTGHATALYHNDAGTLRLIDVGFDDLINGMGIAVGDIDGDLDLDVYVSDIGYTDDGQKLYVNRGDGTFVESAHDWGVAADQHYGWGTEWLDFDNDGDLDLALADTVTDAPFVAENRGGWFIGIDTVIDLPTEPSVGFASADFDRDGRLDVVWWLDESPEPHLVRVMRNTIPAAGNWLEVELRDGGPNTHAIGATVYVESDGVRRMRPLIAGGSFFSSSEPMLHFGLGSASSVDMVEVVWPGGERTTYGPRDAGQRIRIER